MTAFLAIFARVTAGALAGMAMGAAFGWAAGTLTPTFFRHFIPWNDVEPVGFAVVLGGFGGVFLGGGLGVFSVLVGLLLHRRGGAAPAPSPASPTTVR